MFEPEPGELPPPPRISTVGKRNQNAAPAAGGRRQPLDDRAVLMRFAGGTAAPDPAPHRGSITGAWAGRLLTGVIVSLIVILAIMVSTAGSGSPAQRIALPTGGVTIQLTPEKGLYATP